MAIALTPRRRATPRVAAVLTIPFVLLVFGLTLMPERVEVAAPGLVYGVIDWMQQDAGASWFTFELAERLANVLLFVPVGVLTFLILPRGLWPLALLVGVGLSVLVEVAQAALLPGRTTTIDDVIANSLGATAGILLAALFTLIAAWPRTP